MSRKYSLEEVKEKFLQRNFILLCDYINANTKVKVRCLKCNSELEVYPKHIFSGHLCPKCKGNKKYTIDEIEKIFNSKNLIILS